MRRNTLLIVSIFILLFFGLVLVKNFKEKSGQHFTIMAEAFLAGRVDMPRLDDFYNDLDTFSFNGRYYWPAFPFPALLLMPFVFVFNQIGIPFYQGYLQFFLTVGVFLGAYKLATIFRQKKVNALWLAFAFCFASNYSFLAFSTESWYYSQPITVFLVLLSLCEWYTKRRLVLIGFYLSFALATRFTVSLGVLFFILMIFSQSSKNIKTKIFQSILLLLPLFISGCLILTYNHVRFGNMLTTGYEGNNIKPEHQVLMLKRYGLFKIENIPTNVYWYFFAPPDPVLKSPTYHLIPPFFQANPWGMSFFIVSPIFLFILKTIQRKMSKEVLFVWITSGVILSVLLLWYSTGYFQVGPRYLLDVLPLWFILLLTYFRKTAIKPIHCLIILVSALMNLFWIFPYR